MDKNVEIVLDPTMLLEPNEFKKKPLKNLKGDYILIYTYGKNRNVEQINNIKNFAKSKGLKIISAFAFLDWVDKSLGTSPSEFISLISNANYVVTDTFHGTVFSIIFSKQFVSYAQDNTKVLEVLKNFGLESRIVDFPDEISSIMDEQIDYKSIKVMLHEMRNFSLEQLNNGVNFFNNS